MIATLPIPEHVKRRHQRREKLSVAEWAERYRIVTEGPLVGEATGIPWSNAVFPPGVDIMNAAVAGKFRRVIMMAAPQSSGKTALAINCILYMLHWQRRDVMYIHANAMKGYSQYDAKIGPAIAAKPELAEMIPATREERGTKEDHKFVGNRHFLVTGSESEGDLSGSTVPAQFYDDVHAMPANLGTHGHPVEFGEKRADSYPPEERVSIIAGQASDVDNFLYRAICRSAFYVLYLPCPVCGTYQIIDWARMVFDRSSPEAAKTDCWMKCANERCTHQIRHNELPGMLAKYKWISQPPDFDLTQGFGERSGLPSLLGEVEYPGSARPTQDAGFWWNAFSWPLVPWTKHAADYVSATGDPDATKTFLQQAQVVPWAEPKADEDSLDPADLEHHDAPEHHWKCIPAESGLEDGTGTVVVMADVMGGYIWYLAAAWRKTDGTGWLIEAGRFGRKLKPDEIPAGPQREQLWRSRIGKALEELWAKDNAGWPIVNAQGVVRRERSADLVLVDCSFLRETVQLACKMRNGGNWSGKWLPIEGSTCKARGAVPIWPGFNRATVEKKTRRRYWECNTNRAKLYVRELMAIPPGRPGSFSLPGDTPAFIRSAFAKHLCAEEWIAERGAWKQNSGENHLLDCMAGQVIGALAAGVRFEIHDEPAKAPPPGRGAVVTDWFKRQKRR